MARKTAPLPEVTTGNIITVGGFGGTRASKLVEITIGDITFLGLGADKRVYAPCGMCDDSSGYRSAYRHVQSGLCWHCAGSGIHHLYAETLEDAQKKARRTMARRATEARKEAERLEKLADEKAAYRAQYAAEITRVTEWLESRNLLEPGRRVGEYAGLDYAEMERVYHTELYAWCDRRDASVDSWLISTINDILGDINNGDAHKRPNAARWAQAEKFIREYEGKEEARQAEAESSRYAAEDEGVKVTVTGKITFVHGYDTDYGYTRMVIIKGTGQDAGITVKWAGTAKAIWDLEQDQEVVITGTVKALAEYKGVAQTVLTRCKIQ